MKNPAVTLAPGESTTEILQWTPEYGDAGPVELEVWSDHHEAAQTINVEEGPTFPVSIDSTSGPIVGGESLTFSVTVRNTGETTETTPVELFVTNELRAQKTVELVSGEARQVSLTWETTRNDTGARTVEVVSADTTAESRVRIFDSKEVTSPDTATEASENERQNTGIIEILDPGFGVTAALLALLVIALFGYGLYRN